MASGYSRDYSQQGGRRYPPLPEGWLDYSRFGHPIKDTQIVAIKCPLKEAFHNGLLKKVSPPVMSGKKYTAGISKEEEFTPTQCPKQLKEKFGLKLYAVIDLTNTDRYYDPKDFSRAGVQYHKLKCPGQAIPTEEIYKKFLDKVNSYLAEMSPDGLLAVHCTHGLNRTGYLVCRYLIEECGFATEVAIKEFNAARGHDINKQYYLDHLRHGDSAHHDRQDRPRHHQK